MPILQLMVGPPGSGKSTFAKSIARSHAKYISQDEQGKQGHLDAFKEAIKNNQNILLDRMNFNKEQRNRYIAPAKAAGYEVRIQVFHQSYEICLARCIARIGQHETIVDEKGARSALQTFFTKYERPTPDEADKIHFRYPEISEINQAIWVDIDGTIADIEHRRHFVDTTDGKKKDWKSFFDHMDKDELNVPVWYTLKAYEELGFKIVFCSGRPDNYRQQTIDWFDKYKINYDGLFMRHRNDSRQDNIIKEIILDFEVKTRYNILLCLDDRDQVVKMLRSRGLTVFQVNYGDF